MPIVLTGIKPTGTLHLGNYLGAVRPALDLAARHPGSRIFVADVHALNQGTHGEALRTASFDIAAAWIACGLDPEVTLLYRQSDVPEITGLASLLTPLAAKGLMNRAHAYKAARGSTWGCIPIPSSWPPTSSPSRPTSSPWGQTRCNTSR